jgi:DNA helicase II / ATP-dependent DNA helicase PcrA
MNTREFRCYGPPGTGKTTWLSRQAHLAASKHGPSAVVIASLTRAAAAEVAGRETPVPEKNIGTLHSHAFHALDRPSIVEASDGIKAWNEQANYAWKIGAGNRINDPENAPLEATLAASEGDRLLSDMNVYRQRMVPRDLWRQKVRRFANEWDDFKTQTNRIDFTDLIEKALEDVDQHPVNPAVFLLDEAQDMSKLEMALARKWGAHAQTFVIVGDPFQNLYEWRGSDPSAFTAGEVSGTKILDQSYRVPAAVQEYAVNWVRKIVKEGELFPEYKPRDEPGEVRVSPYTWQYPEPLIRAFEEDVERGYSVMFLTSCSYMLNPMVAALRERGVPFHNPYRAVHGGWNPLRYADRVLAFMRPIGNVWGDDARVWSWSDLELWTDVLAAKDTMKRGSKSIIEANIAKIEAKPRFAREELEAPLSVEKIQSLFKEESFDPIFSMDLDWLRANTRDSRKRVIDYPVAVAKKYGGKALMDEPKIIVGTIHSVKGGEADSVYVCPDLSRQGFDAWRRYGAERDAIYRQFYVAFTRARTKLSLCSPHGGDTVIFPRP